MLFSTNSQLDRVNKTIWVCVSVTLQNCRTDEIQEPLNSLAEQIQGREHKRDLPCNSPIPIIQLSEDSGKGDQVDKTGSPVIYTERLEKSCKVNKH